ncbi:MAG: hypothetical protein RLZZ373_3194 [Pseudomonadota bacterium]|jgi:hypothetical protein
MRSRVEAEQLGVDDLLRITGRWFATRRGSVLGWDFGNGISDALQAPMTAIIADRVTADLRADLPILNRIGGDPVAIYEVDTSNNRKVIIAEVLGKIAWVGGGA